MTFYKIAFGACLLLLCGSYAALMAAQRKGDKGQARVLHFFRLGLSLSAISYLLRITDTPRASHSFLIFVTCLLGTVFIWRGWIEHWKLRRERLKAPAALPDIMADAKHILLYAQSEALCRNDCCVDTEHLLLGLLHERPSAGEQLLQLLGVNPEKVQQELVGQMAERTKTEPLALTEAAQQVLTLAAQEAHRFDATSVGSEHLLLGLVLVGKGKAASVLFGQGVTVDNLRNAILETKPRVGTQKR